MKFEYVLEKDFDLNQATADDRNILNPELSLAFLYNPGKNVQMFLNLGLSEEVTFSSSQLIVSQAYITMKKELRENLLSAFQQPGGEGDTSILTLQIGRQRFKDEREWLFDEEMDAVRLSWVAGDALVELS